MAMKPLSDWIATYEPRCKDYYALAGAAPGIPAEVMWQSWVDPNAQGIAVIPPYATSTGTTTKGNFSPIVTGAAMLPPVTALMIATAWLNWYTSITWSTPAPAPPFSVIFSVVSSPAGSAASFAILLAGLIAEFSILPSDPATAFQLKATAYATLINTATKTAGVQISGLGIGGPPPPLVLPLVPVL